MSLEEAVLETFEKVDDPWHDNVVEPFLQAQSDQQHEDYQRYGD